MPADFVIREAGKQAQERLHAFTIFCDEAAKAIPEYPYKSGLVTVLSNLSKWHHDMLHWFTVGFESGQLEIDRDYSPSYVYDQICNIAQRDLSMVERIAGQDRLYEGSPCWNGLRIAEDLSQQAMQPAYDAGMIDKLHAYSYYDDEPQTRTVPYAPVMLVSSPYFAGKYMFDMVVAWHEVGHSLWDYAEIAEGGIDDNVPLMLERLPEWLRGWDEEIFSDVYAAISGGAPATLWFMDRLAAVPNFRPNRLGFRSWATDSGSHPVSVLRPFVFLKILAFRNDPATTALWSYWMDVGRSRGGFPRTFQSVREGQMIEVPLRDVVELSPYIDVSKPVDQAVLSLYAPLSGLKQSPITQSGAVDVAGVRSAWDSMVREATKAPGYVDYTGVEIPTRQFDEVLGAWLPAVQGQIPQEIWGIVLNSGGWTKRRQHSVRGA